MDVTEYTNSMDRLCFKVSTPKMNSEYHVVPHRGGYNFYQVVSTKGQVADVLVTRFSSPDAALKAIRKYIDSIKETKTVRRDKRTQERERDKLNAKAIRSDSKEHVQQGTSD